MMDHRAGTRTSVEYAARLVMIELIPIPNTFERRRSTLLGSKACTSSLPSTYVFEGESKRHLVSVD